MGMDTNPLPPGLAVMLTDINDTFNETFLRLAVKISPSEYFDIAFKLKQKIDDIEEYGQGAEDWFYKLLVRDVPLTKEHMHDCLMAFVLNAEYMLFQFYCQFELYKNPFLVHWVEVIKKWEEVFGKEAVDPKGKGKATTSMRKADSDIFEKRLHFVKAILLNEGPTFGNWTPKEFCDRFAEKDRVVDLHYYTVLLSDMDELAETGDLEVPSETATFSANDGIMARLMQQKLALQDRFTELLTNSPHGPLDKEEVNMVIRELEEDPTIITIFNIRYVETTVVVTTEVNPQWTLKILRILLGHPQIRADRRLDLDRQALLERIAHFPVTVNCLDLITTLIISNCFEDVPWLVHTFLDNALRGLSELETTHRQNTNEGIAESAEMPVARARNRALEVHQIQGVRYLILFIRSLVNKGIMSAQDLATQINEIGVRLAWLPEARQFQKQMLSLPRTVAASRPVVHTAPSVAGSSTLRPPVFPVAVSQTVSSNMVRPAPFPVASPQARSSSAVHAPVFPGTPPQDEPSSVARGLALPSTTPQAESSHLVRSLVFSSTPPQRESPSMAQGPAFPGTPPQRESSTLVRPPLFTSTLPQRESPSPARGPAFTSISPQIGSPTAGRGSHFGRGQIRYQTPRGSFH